MRFLRSTTLLLGPLRKKGRTTMKMHFTAGFVSIGLAWIVLNGGTAARAYVPEGWHLNRPVPVLEKLLAAGGHFQGTLRRSAVPCRLEIQRWVEMDKSGQAHPAYRLDVWWYTERLEDKGGARVYMEVTSLANVTKSTDTLLVGYANRSDQGIEESADTWEILLDENGGGFSLRFKESSRTLLGRGFRIEGHFDGPRQVLFRELHDRPRER